jgi:hypothetical protein
VAFLVSVFCGASSLAFLLLSSFVGATVVLEVGVLGTGANAGLTTVLLVLGSIGFIGLYPLTLIIGQFSTIFA